MDSGFVTYGTLAQKELPLHRNVGMELVYVSAGHLRWEVDERVEDVEAGQVFFTLPWQVHGSVYRHEPGNLIHFIQFKLDRLYRKPARSFAFDPVFDFPTRAARGVSRVFSEAERHTWRASPQLKWLTLTLIETLEQRRESDRLFVQGLFRSMIAALAHVVSGEVSEDAHLSSTERRVSTFLRNLRRVCQDRWTLSDMSGSCGLKRTHFSECVKTLTGDSPMIYLGRLRIERAEQLLRTTDLPITEIGFECGFSTTQLFSRTFRKFTNQTPTGYRRETRSDAKRPVHVWTEEDERQRFEAFHKRRWV